MSFSCWNGRGPVPFTGRRRQGGHCFRHIRTAQARRQAQTLGDDLPPRAARGLRSLPTAWDDVPVSSRRDTCWKGHRKTQWRSA